MGKLSHFYLVFLASFIFLFIECGKKDAPPGGTIDSNPPVISETYPVNKSINIDTSSVIVIKFNEPISKYNFSPDFINITPPVGKIKVKWDKENLLIIPENSFKANKTYIITIKKGIRDLHGVATTTDSVFAFSTGAIIDTFKISGKLTLDKKPASNATIYIYKLKEKYKGKKPPDTEKAKKGKAPNPNYISYSNQNGEYIFKYVSDGIYMLLAFMDQNKDGIFQEGEPFHFEPSLTFNGLTHISDANFTLIGPNSPADVSGKIFYTGTDTLHKIYIEARSPKDSTVIKRIVMDTVGTYKFSNLLPQPYIFFSFGDVNKDAKFNDTLDYYGFYPDTVFVRPARDTTGIDIKLLKPLHK